MSSQFGFLSSVRIAFWGLRRPTGGGLLAALVAGAFEAAALESGSARLGLGASGGLVFLGGAGGDAAVGCRWASLGFGARGGLSVPAHTHR